MLIFSQMKIFLRQMGQPIDRESLHTILLTEEQVYFILFLLSNTFKCIIVALYKKKVKIANMRQGSLQGAESSAIQKKKEFHMEWKEY